MLRAWVEAHRYGSANTTQFTALAEDVIGRELNGFFRAWLYKPEEPAKRFMPKFVASG